jgi:large subunit ribosomal protein L25
MSFQIKAEIKKIHGKNASRRLRKEGKIPAVFYGHGIGTVNLALNKKDIIDVLRSDSGENTIFKVSYDSKTSNAMIKDIQRDPVTDEVLHVDLVLIVMDKAMRVSIPITLVGEAVGVKSEGGFIDSMTREVEVECLPKDIPENIEVDIQDLHLHQSIKVADIQVPEKVKLVSDPEAVVVVIAAPTKEEVEVKEEEEEEEEVIAEEEEPEVIKKEKEETEEKE